MTTASASNFEEASASNPTDSTSSSPAAVPPPRAGGTGNKQLDDLLRQIAADDSSSDDESGSESSDSDSSSSSSSEEGGGGGRPVVRGRGRSRSLTRGTNSSAAEEEEQKKKKQQQEQQRDLGIQQCMQRHGLVLRRQSSLDRQAKIEDGDNDAVHIRSLLQRASVDESGDGRANLKYQHMDPTAPSPPPAPAPPAPTKSPANNNDNIFNENTVLQLLKQQQHAQQQPQQDPPPMRTVSTKTPMQDDDGDVDVDDPNQVSDLELGYEDISTDHQNNSPNNSSSKDMMQTQPAVVVDDDTNNKGGGGMQDSSNRLMDMRSSDIKTTRRTGNLLEDEEEEEEEGELSLWERIPLGLTIAMGLFALSLLGSTWMIWSYLVLRGFGMVSTFIVVSVIAGGFLGSAYIIANTFWYTQMDLEHALDQQDKARAILSNVYPEHILQRLLPDLDDSQYGDEQQQHEDIEALCKGGDPAGADKEETSEQTSLLNPNRNDRSYGTVPPQQLQLVNTKQSDPERMAAIANRMEKMKKAMNQPATLKRRSSMSNTFAQMFPRRLSKPRRLSGNHQLHHPHHGGAAERRGSATGGGSSSHHQSDLFPNTTVFHAEIVGFTAWSSQRSPNQVFDLLQRVFSDMDQHAQGGGVFKVESFGESYIAVTGLPEPDPDHAVRMAKFAADCLSVFHETTAALERTLGPDTGELQLRIGLNSGPVTAGVLRGDKSRFQLFGNTVNNAVRAEKQGEGNRVHITRETSELLERAGKGHWMVAREPSVAGKTFWLIAAEKNERRGSCSSYAKLVELPTGGLEEPAHHSDGALLPPGSVVHDDRSVGNMSHISEATGISLGSTGNATVDSKKTWTMQDILTAKEQRLIEWTVDQLALMLQKILARRAAVKRYEERMGLAGPESNEPPTGLYYIPQDDNETVLDEVQEMLVIPHYNNKMVLEEAVRGYKSLELPERALEELTNYVSTVTTFYYDPSRNPFHNFMHASHVLMSVVKMMQRIISPTQAAMEKDKKLFEESDDRSVGTTGTSGTPRRRWVKRSISWEDLHDHTFGITTDPLTQFAVVFAALIHDLDHPGVPNAQLVKEETRLARIYKNRSISEQNSLDMAWDLLMDPSYQNLVRAICGTQEELKRFRQLLVQTVMATDIADADLRADRNARWEKAFAKKPKTATKKKEESSKEKKEDGDAAAGEDDSSVATEATNATSLSTANDDASATSRPSLAGSPTGRRTRSTETEEGKNRKATIVLEHLLQASDIAHTMQHWEVFRKWNEKLYREMYLAYLHGRAEKDPADFWYNGEIGFFKFYIIPLAKKLSDCGVFGVSSDEYLNYAEQNLEIWESKGREVVEEVSAAAYRDYGTKEEPKIEGLQK